MKKLIYILIALIFVYLCIEFFAVNSMSPGDRLSAQLVNRVGGKLENKYSMFMSGTGGGEKNGIWLITTVFHQNGEPKTIPMARRMIVDCMEEFLAAVNTDEKLRPYLQVYPFTSKNISISIIFSDPEGNDVHDPDLEVVSAFDDLIDYRTRDPKNEYKYKFEFTESYDEALAIVKKENIANSTSEL